MLQEVVVLQQEVGKHQPELCLLRLCWLARIVLCLKPYQQNNNKINH